jgi:hypothetical protein
MGVSTSLTMLLSDFELQTYVVSDTIITSFPRRWGRNKPDPSGVHKCLRERLENIADGQIQSIYDLGKL